MDENGANIDIVFRNGLKDFELLPPPGVWDNIHPVLKGKPKTYILLSAAASIAVLLTISFFTYQWTREISTEIENSVMAINEESALPLINPDIVVNPLFSENESDIVQSSVKTLIEYPSSETIIAVNNSSTASNIDFMAETDDALSTGTASFNIQDRGSLTSLVKQKFEINKIDQQYFPENDEFNSTERWSIAALASPTYYSRFNSGSNELSTQLKASEKAIVSYSGGVAFTYKLNKRFSIQSGLYYASLGQEVNGVHSYSGFQQYDNTKGDHNFEVLTTNGVVYTSNPDVFLSSNGPAERILTNFTRDVFDPQKANLQYIDDNIRQNFSYLELPIIMRYKVVDKIIDFNLIGGVSYNLLVSNSVYTLNDGGKYLIGKTERLNPVAFSSSLGLGMEYNISEKFSFNLEPTLRYYLNAFDGVENSGIHPYSFGIFSGVSYKF